MAGFLTVSMRSRTCMPVRLRARRRPSQLPNQAIANAATNVNSVYRKNPRYEWEWSEVMSSTIIAESVENPPHMPMPKPPLASWRVRFFTHTACDM